MTNEQTMTLILKDATGSYFLVPQAVLEQGRVPAEQQVEVERLIAVAAQGDSEGEDTQGYRSSGSDYLVIMALGSINQVLAGGNTGSAGSIGQQASDLGNALPVLSYGLGRQ